MVQRLSLFLFFVAPVIASGQSIEILGPPPPSTPEVFAKDDRGRITIRATRATIDLDGNLDENIYETVPPLDHFVQPGTERRQRGHREDSSVVLLR